MEFSINSFLLIMDIMKIGIKMRISLTDEW
jgi:hypothetical protein